MNGSLERAHPNIYKFIGLIKKEQKKFELKLMQMQTGGKVSRPKKQYRDLEQNFQDAISRYSVNHSEEAYKVFLDDVIQYVHL